jgi:Bromodomain
MGTYSKIINHPIDMGRVCRRIRRRQYKCLRDVRLDCWRIFANCVRYHSHAHNKNAVPSFVSIALHLRGFFNDLWQEYMLPSDFPGHKSPTPGSGIDKDAILRSDMDQRTEDRRRRLIVAGLSVMAGKYLEHAADSLKRLVKNGGRVDKLDTRPVWGEGVDLDDEDEADLEIVLTNLRQLETKLHDMVSRQDGELGVDELETLIRNCYSSDADGLETMRPTLRMQIATRLDRYMGQLIVPIHEATCRGVSQSSIWGCMAAGVWARESSKKPFWPALVLGIMAPEDQKEAWHQALTERNEERLPDKLKAQLVGGKRNAEKAIKRQSQGQAEPQSFFLVEFLGTHEFIWVREADIVENFNAEEDPNKNDNVGANKKKRVSKSHLANILSSKTYANAIDEITWAMEEFELQLQDIGGDPEERSDDYAESGYTYDILAQSDDEFGKAEDDDPESETVDVDECNELLETKGLLDLSAAGIKRRNQLKKQQKAKEERKLKAQKARKEKAVKAKKEKELKVKAKEKDKEKKQNQRDVERRRRKRIREREKALMIRDIALKDYAPGKRHTIPNKRVRAEAIVNGYLMRDHLGSKEYKPLCLGKGANGILNISAALIDSTNLIGMTLAFRAASGDIPMPEESSVHLTKSYKETWNSISLKGKKASTERSAALKRQIEILESEIGRSKVSKKRRLELIQETKAKVVKTEEKLIGDDRYARVNPLLKFKKTNPSAGKKRTKSPSIDMSTASNDDDAVEVVAGSNKDDEVFETDSEAPDFDVLDAETADAEEAEADALEDDEEDSAADGEMDESQSVDDAMEVDSKA